jgi:hypothetical protein
MSLPEPFDLTHLPDSETMGEHAFRLSVAVALLSNRPAFHWRASDINTELWYQPSHEHTATAVDASWHSDLKFPSKLSGLRDQLIKRFGIEGSSDVVTVMIGQQDGTCAKCCVHIQCELSRMTFAIDSVVTRDPEILGRAFPQSSSNGIWKYVREEGLVMYGRRAHAERIPKVVHYIRRLFATLRRSTIC